MDAVLDRLSDALFIQAIRTYLRNESGTGVGTALADPAVRAALRLKHESPGRKWTLGSLTREVAVLRSSFAQRFAAALCEWPIAYLTRWGIALAKRLLRDGATIAEVAEGVRELESISAGGLVF